LDEPTAHTECTKLTTDTKDHPNFVFFVNFVCFE